MPPHTPSYDAIYRARVGLAPGPVFAILGALSAAYFAITGTVWAVTGEFTRLGGHAAELFGAHPRTWQYYANVTTLSDSPLGRTDGWIVIAMLAGSLIAALYSGDFRVRLPPLKRRFAQAFAGGIIAGSGARMAYGCNLAAMFTGIPQFSLHAWLFTLATAVGTWVGVKVIRLRAWRGPTIPQPAQRKEAVPNSQLRLRRWRHRSIAALVLLGLILAGAVYMATGRGMLAVAIIFGTVFGVLIQRGQICFTAAFRDLWVVGKTKLADSLVIGLAAAVGTTFLVFLLTDAQPLTKPAGWGTLLGGFLFGLGIILAGACETGMMYRAMEGQVQAWLAFAGNVLGATMLAYGWDHWGLYDLLVAGAPHVNLVGAFGLWGALAVSLMLLAAWWVAMRPLRRQRRAQMDSRLTTAEGQR